MIVDTLLVFYYEKMVGYMPSSFVDLVFVGERIEVGLRRGKFDYAAYKGYWCIAGEEDKSVKTSRQLRKQAARRPSNSSFNEDVEDNNDLDPSYNSNGAELQENYDAYEVDYPSRKRKVSNSSQKKHVAKNGKTSQKPKKANDDLEKSEEPPKKFSHSTR